MWGRKKHVDDLVTLELTVSDPPAGWVTISLDEAWPAQEWALAVHRFLAEEIELAGGTVDHDAVAEAAQTLGRIADDARGVVRDRGGFAHAWVPDPQRPVQLWLDVVARPEDGFADWAENLFTRVLPLVDPQGTSTEVDLPAGPGLRVRSLTVPENSGDPVTEGVDVLVRAPGVPGRVVLSSRWVALSEGDRFAELVDEFSTAVRVRVVPDDADA